MESQEESQEPVLPEGLFRNRFTWFWYERSKNTTCWVFSGLVVIVGLAMIRIGINCKGYLDPSCPSEVWFAAGAGAFISAAFCPYFIESTTLGWIIHLKSSSKYSSQVAQKVLELNPGSSIEKWDLISSHLNNYFYCNNNWNTPYFFFDGKDAQDLFTEEVLNLYLQGNLNLRDVAPAKAYLQSLREEFDFDLQDALPEISPESELNEESKRKRFSEYLECGLSYILPVGQFCAMVLAPMMLFGMVAAFDFVISPLFLSCFFIIYTITYACSLIAGFYSLDLLSDRARPLRLRHVIKFVAMVRRVTRDDTFNERDKWYEIAKYMNQYLSDEPSSGSSFQFSSSNDCREFDLAPYFELKETGIIGDMYIDFLCFRILRTENPIDSI